MRKYPLLAAIAVVFGVAAVAAYAVPCVNMIPGIAGAPTITPGSTTTCPVPQGDPPADPPLPNTTCPQNYTSSWALACNAPKLERCCGAGQAKVGEVVSYTCNQDGTCKKNTTDVMAPAIAERMCVKAGSHWNCTDNDPPPGGGN